MTIAGTRYHLAAPVLLWRRREGLKVGVACAQRCQLLRLDARRRGPRRERLLHRLLRAALAAAGAGVARCRRGWRLPHEVLRRVAQAGATSVVHKRDISPSQESCSSWRPAVALRNMSMSGGHGKH